LHYAAENSKCDFEILKYLIELGADTNIINDEDENALIKYFTKL